MAEPGQAVVLKDATLREGLDVPGVSLATPERVAIAEALAGAGVPEVEAVAPGRVLADLAVAREIRARGLSIRVSGLVYANGAGWRGEIESAGAALDRVDLLMPLSMRRRPFDPAEKATRLEAALDACGRLGIEVGAGFPHATQATPAFVVEIAHEAARAGARRITLYDTNGAAEPFGVRDLVAAVVATVNVPVFFHAHDDLGLATANAWAAVAGGAHGLDVTVNGLGDRAGNAALEQVVVLLRSRGMSTGVEPSALRTLSRLVEELSGVTVSRLAPVVGPHAFDHRSPAHREAPEEFEAFDPAWVGRTRYVHPAGAAATPPAPS